MVINKIVLQKEGKYMSLPTRNEVSDDLKWDLSRVFENDQEWEKEYQQVTNEIKNISKH